MVIGLGTQNSSRDLVGCRAQKGSGLHSRSGHVNDWSPSSQKSWQAKGWCDMPSIVDSNHCPDSRFRQPKLDHGSMIRFLVRQGLMWPNPELTPCVSVVTTIGSIQIRYRITPGQPAGERSRRYTTSSPRVFDERQCCVWTLRKVAVRATSFSRRCVRQ
jgi:hypothetical protein